MARARQRARELDPAGESIFFSPWFPYPERENLYAAADVAVSLAREGLETDLSYRTRLLDAAWGGVPSVTVGGGALARELAESGAGIAAPFRAEDLARAILEVLGSRDRFSASARRFAEARTWARVATPLVAWCGEASVDPGRRPFPEEEARPLWRRLWQGAS
jgi:glycosyltransferase involved in cell wall biosynthesis